MSYQGTRRKVFISHYKGDHEAVEKFIRDYSSVFIPRVLGANENYEFVESNNTDYVMRVIRQKYLEDTTVTTVLTGDCTHSRRYVDWEIKSSLTQGSQTPNGLIGILLPYKGTQGHLPERFKDNWNSENQDCYARYYSYPTSEQQLGAWIDDAFDSRTTRREYIKNTQDMMKYNGKCLIHGETH